MAALPGYRDVFSCIACQAVRDLNAEFKCGACSSYVCEHLVLIDGGLIICFCCYKDQSREWPDWCYAMLPEPEE